MSESDKAQPAIYPAAPGGPAPGDEGESRRFRLSRRGWTVLLSVLVVVVFGVIGAVVRIPYVALGPGPTYDTLGEVDTGPVIKIDGADTFKTAGELRLTTVSLTQEITLIGGLGLWVSGRYALAPREEYFPPDKTDDDVKEQNVKLFEDSQTNAEVAALRYLNHPVKVLADEIQEGSPADSLLEAGDRLLVVNGVTVAEAEDVRNSLKGTKPGDEISLTFQRDGERRQERTITLAERPDGLEQGFIGLVPTDHADVDFSIDIELAEVGGPSAGLMFALAIVDRLTEDELTAGKKVAGSGEISSRGEVGPIGGISFKLVSAGEQGVTTFLVPEQNCPEALRAAPEGMRLVKVATLGDAVDALTALSNGGDAPSC